MRRRLWLIPLVIALLISAGQGGIVNAIFSLIGFILAVKVVGPILFRKLKKRR